MTKRCGLPYEPTSEFPMEPEEDALRGAPCQKPAGHDGSHHASVEGKGRVTWTVLAPTECGEKLPDTGLEYRCFREPGHDGQHAVYYGHKLRTWDTDSMPDRWAPQCPHEMRVGTPPRCGLCNIDYRRVPESNDSVSEPVTDYDNDRIGTEPADPPRRKSPLDAEHVHDPGADGACWCGATALEIVTAEREALRALLSEWLDAGGGCQCEDDPDYTCLHCSTKEALDA